jgi:hypothetical protein
MPSKESLPDGPRREFVTELRRYYRPARPSLREISQTIEKHPDPRVHEITASAETVRRTITGKVLPVDRDRVYAVFRALCELADINPDAPRDNSDYDSRYEPPPETNWQCVQRLWDAALEEEADAPPFRGRPRRPHDTKSILRQASWTACRRRRIRIPRQCMRYSSSEKCLQLWYGQDLRQARSLQVKGTFHERKPAATFPM